MIFLDLRPGKSVSGDPILAYKSEKKSDKYTYLMAGVHGDEVEGVYVLKKLFDWLKENDTLDKPIIVIPILNVDGHRSNSRVNAHGVDLNRNFPSICWEATVKEEKYNPGPRPLSEPENIFLEKLFKKFPPKEVITFHSWVPMLNYNGDCKDIADFLHQYNQYKVCDTIKGHKTPGSLGQYAPEKYNCPVLTLELPVLSDDISLKSLWEDNKEGLTKLLLSNII